MKISRNLVTLTKQWEINTARDDEKLDLEKRKNKTFILESVIFVTLNARQKSGNYTLRMIVKVAWYDLYGTAED